MAALSSLYSSVRVFANQCPDATIDKFLIEAVREFCRKSYFYQEELSINVVASTATYTVTPSSSQELITVTSVRVDDVPYAPVRTQEVNDVVGDWQYQSYRFEPNSSVTVYPTPTENVTNGLVVQAVIMPPENTTTVPDVIYRHHKETIVAGALYYILSMQNEAWSNTPLAATKRAEFISGMNTAKRQRSTGFVDKNLSMRARSFAI